MSDKPTPKRSKRQTADDELRHSVPSLAKEFGITDRTVRFYEQKGLIAANRAEPIRSRQRIRYTEAHRERLGRILEARELGLSVQEIKDHLAKPRNVEAGIPDALSKSAVQAQIKFLEGAKGDIEIKLARLRALLAAKMH